MIKIIGFEKRLSRQKKCYRKIRRRKCFHDKDGKFIKVGDEDELWKDEHSN